MNTLRVRQLLFVMMSAHCLSLHSMEIIENNNALVWDVFIVHSLSCNDYRTYRNVAMLNKQCNTMIEDTYRPQKKRIENFIQSKSTSVTGHRSWNKDFSKCAWVTISDDGVGQFKKLQLTVVGLLDGGKRVTSSSRLWREFYCPVFEDDVRPFFDTYGRACFDGCGVGQLSFGTLKDIMEYCIDLDGESKKFHCLCYVPNPTEWADDYEFFVHLLNFPLLMKALFQSTNIRYQKNYKQYYARWAILPKDWMTFKQHVAFKQIEHEEGISEDQSSLYKTSDSFSESLQLVIQELVMNNNRKNNYIRL